LLLHHVYLGQLVLVLVLLMAQMPYLMHQICLFRLEQFALHHRHPSYYLQVLYL
jgi:hypothetical protein